MSAKIDRRTFLKIAGTAVLAVSLHPVMASAEEEEITSYEESWTYRYFTERGISNNNFYVTAYLSGETQNGVVMMTKHDDAARLRYYYVDTSEEQALAYSENLLVLGDELFELNTEDQEYMRYSDNIGCSEATMPWWAADVRLAGNGWFIVPAAETIRGMYTEAVEIDGEVYRAERIKICTDAEKTEYYNYYSMTYYYDATGDLKFTKSVGGAYVQIQKLSPEPNDGLLIFPENYRRVKQLDHDPEFSIKDGEEPKI